MELELSGRHISDMRITSEITMLGAIQMLHHTMGMGGGCVGRGGGSVWISTDQHLEGERFNVISITRGRG